MRITPRWANQPVNAQLKYAVPADQPYSQPFWLREPKHGRHLHHLRPALIGLPDDPPLLNLRFGSRPAAWRSIWCGRCGTATSIAWMASRPAR
jgi:hypothetical protein